MHIPTLQAACGLALFLADTVQTKAVFAHYMVELTHIAYRKRNPR